MSTYRCDVRIFRLEKSFYIIKIHCLVGLLVKLQLVIVPGQSAPEFNKLLLPHRISIQE